MEHYALATGATSGLELVYVKWFAGKGYNLIMTGRRKEVIEKRAQGIRDRYTCRAIVILVDLASEGEVRKLLASLKDREVHVLVNNANFGFRTSFNDTDIDELERLIYLRTTAVAEITHHVLKEMKEWNKGIIVDTSSSGTFAVVPGNVTYAASKRPITTLTEGFHIELMGTEIRAQAVCLGFMNTNFHESNGMHVDKTREDMFGFRQPEDMVDEAMKEFEEGKVICIPDKAGKLVKATTEYMPKRVYYRSASDFMNKNIRKNRYVAALTGASVHTVLTSANTNKCQY